MCLFLGRIVHQRPPIPQDRNPRRAPRRAARVLADVAARRSLQRAVVGDPASGPDLLRSRLREGVEAGHGPDGSVGHGGSGHHGAADVWVCVEQYERADGGGDEFRVVGRVDSAGCECSDLWREWGSSEEGGGGGGEGCVVGGFMRLIGVFLGDR